ITVNRSHVALNTPIKSIGQYKVPLALHPEVEANVIVLVARSEDEAQRLARGEDVTVRREPGDEDEAAAFFEPEAAEQRREREEPAEQTEDDAEAAPAKAAKGKKKADAAEK